jgi:hypothetical protein
MIIRILSNINGMALWPFILIRKDLKGRSLERTLNHERIHLEQQKELLVLPFYVLYVLNYLVNLFYYGNHLYAYYNIVFELEAFENDINNDYLKTRKRYSWLSQI